MVTRRAKAAVIQAGLVLAGAGLMALVSLKMQGPTYAGQSVQFWFKRLCQGSPTLNTNYVSLRALTAIGEAAVPYLVERAFDFNPGRLRELQISLFWGTDSTEVQRRAENVLRVMRPSFDALGPRVIPKLHAQDPFLRREALMLLGFTGEGAPKAVPYLMEALNHPDALTTVVAMQSLQWLGPAASAALPELIRGLDNQALRLNAMEALRKIGPAAAEVLPKLKVFFQGTNIYERLVAAAAIRRIEPTHNESLEFLIATALSQNTDSANAVRLLGELAEEDRPFVVPVLLQCLGEKNSHLASFAQLGLQRMQTDPKRLIEVLSKGLKAPDDMTCFNTAFWILHIDVGHEESLAKLVEIVRSCRSYSLPAIKALGEFGLEAGVPVLEEVSENRDERIRKAAKEALKTIELSRRGARD